MPRRPHLVFILNYHLRPPEGALFDWVNEQMSKPRRFAAMVARILKSAFVKSRKYFVLSKRVFSLGHPYY
jgi:hypothetical protein